MPSVKECQAKVEELVKSHGFGNSKEDAPLKLLFAFVEVGEAVKAWQEAQESGNLDDVVEELVDVLFYTLDFHRLSGFPDLDDRRSLSTISAQARLSTPEEHFLQLVRSLAETADAWKKGKDARLGAQLTDRTIDSIVLTARCVKPDSDLDQAFVAKFEKNMRRPFRYGEAYKR
ncbi:MAG: hypothetical protein QW767_02250 [Thermoprotei archaeon]